jgi:hypothetical protein
MSEENSTAAPLQSQPSPLPPKFLPRLAIVDPSKVLGADPKMNQEPKFSMIDRSRMTMASALAIPDTQKTQLNLTVKSPLNTSPSKQLFTFSKATRFQD